MRSLLILALLPLLSTQATARQIQTEVNIDAGNLTERACYFEGRRYSEGAVLKDESGSIRCGVLDGVTENGALGWLREGEGESRIEQREESGSRVIEIRK